MTAVFMLSVFYDLYLEIDEAAYNESFNADSGEICRVISQMLRTDGAGYEGCRVSNFS